MRLRGKEPIVMAMLEGTLAQFLIAYSSILKAIPIFGISYMHHFHLNILKKLLNIAILTEEGGNQ